MGRKSKLNEELREVIETQLHKGATYYNAAAYAGVSHATANRWLRRGKKDLEAGEETEFASLALAVQRLHADQHIQAESLIMSKINEGSEKSAQWLLSRRMRDVYGDKVEHSHTASWEGLLELLLPHLKPESREDVINVVDRLRRVAGEAAAGDSPGEDETD